MGLNRKRGQSFREDRQKVCHNVVEYETVRTRSLKDKKTKEERIFYSINTKKSRNVRVPRRLSLPMNEAAQTPGTLQGDRYNTCG